MGTDGDRSHQTTTGSTAGKMFAAVSSVIVAIAGGLLCIHAIGGIAGIVVGTIVAGLLYIGVGMLLEPRARIDGVIASDIPDGEAAAVQVSQARTLCGQLESMRASVRDSQVSAEIDELIHDIDALAAFVEHQPSAHRRLAHFLTVYGSQCVPMLRGYLAVESGAGTQSYASAHADAIDAFNALEGAAQGELERAMSGKVTELSVGSEAVKRLMEMDGYTSDRRGEPHHVGHAESAERAEDVQDQASTEAGAQTIQGESA